MVLKKDRRAELIQEAQDERVRDSEALFKRTVKSILTSIAYSQGQLDEYREKLSKLEVTEISSDSY